jgi:hypothetical protein
MSSLRGSGEQFEGASAVGLGATATAVRIRHGSAAEIGDLPRIARGGGQVAAPS